MSKIYISKIEKLCAIVGKNKKEESELIRQIVNMESKNSKLERLSSRKMDEFIGIKINRGKLKKIAEALLLIEKERNRRINLNESLYGKSIKFYPGVTVREIYERLIGEI